jgi:hypothetical protein
VALREAAFGAPPFSFSDLPVRMIGKEKGAKRNGNGLSLL